MQVLGNAQNSFQAKIMQFAACLSCYTLCIASSQPETPTPGSRHLEQGQFKSTETVAHVLPDAIK